MPSTKIKTAAIEDTFRDVERMLNQLAWKHCNKRKQNFEDYQAVANLAYTKAYRSYDPSRGASFVTWAWHCANGALRSYKSKMARQYANEKQSGLPLPAVKNKARQARHFYDRAAPDLSNDALIVLKLIADAPGELAKYFRYARQHPRKARQAIRTRKARQAIRNHLRDEGWKPSRMIDVFDEIEEVIHEDT